jgi:hypothetical protein
MVTAITAVSIQRDLPAVFSWEPSEAGTANVAVYIDVTVNPHGATTGWIECVVEDDGEFEVPAELVTELVDLGLSGFPSASLGRRSTDGVQAEPGCIDLRISSEITLDLEVDGLISCTTDADCPEGQSCSVELACLDDE